MLSSNSRTASRNRSQESRSKHVRSYDRRNENSNENAFIKRLLITHQDRGSGRKILIVLTVAPETNPYLLASMTIPWLAIASIEEACNHNSGAQAIETLRCTSGVYAYIRNLGMTLLCAVSSGNKEHLLGATTACSLDTAGLVWSYRRNRAFSALLRGCLQSGMQLQSH